MESKEPEDAKEEPGKEAKLSRPAWLSSNSLQWDAERGAYKCVGSLSITRDLTLLRFAGFAYGDPEDGEIWVEAGGVQLAWDRVKAGEARREAEHKLRNRTGSRPMTST